MGQQDFPPDWRNKWLPAEACGEARAFCRSFANAQAAWDACQRPDWLCWYLANRPDTDPARRRNALVRVAMTIADEVIIGAPASGEYLPAYVATLGEWLRHWSPSERAPIPEYAPQHGSSFGLACVLRSVVASAHSPEASLTAVAQYAVMVHTTKLQQTGFVPQKCRTTYSHMIRVEFPNPPPPEPTP